MAIVAVLDIGKTTVKLCLAEGGGRTLAERRRPNPSRPDPYPHFDVEGIWDFVLGGLAEFGRHWPISAIVATAHGACAALVDADGLVLPVMDYEFDGYGALDAAYDALRPDFAETLSPPLACGLNLGRQLFYLEHHFPREFARARHLLTWPQYWAWRLGGRAAAEVTCLGCHTDLWSPTAAAPSRLMRARGWDRLLPPMAPAWEVLGMIAPAVAARTGLPETTRVLSGLHDSNAGLLRPLAQQALPFTVVSTGTWVVIMAPGGSLDRLDPALDMLGNVDALGRPVPCIKFMGGREYGVLAGADTAPATPADLAAVIAAGIMALPGFAGQSGPFAGRVGRVVPDGAAPSPALAVLYIALMTDWCLERLGAAGPVIVEGSFVRTPLYAPLLAALGPSRRVLVSADTTGTVGGAVLLAGWPDAWPEGAPSAVTALDLPGLGPYRERWRAACADLPAGGIPR